MNKKNTIDYIRPAGAFPNTPEGWKEYEDQWELVEPESKSINSTIENCVDMVGQEITAIKGIYNLLRVVAGGAK